MRFDDAYIPGPLLWSSPFIRWQGAAADLSSLDLAVQVTRDALAARDFDPASITQLIYGTTVPQVGSFYAAPLVAARMGLAGVGGPTVSQACAISVACVAQAAAVAQLTGGEAQLVVTADRVSNGPLMVYPRANAMGGAPATEHWVLDNFKCDPWTGESMIHTAEETARDGGFTREQADEVALLRWSQYQQALADDRRIQQQYFQPIVIQQRKGQIVLAQDDLDRARALLGAAQQVVARRHGDLHDGLGAKLIERTENQTFYQYGYLFMADTLCYWNRELVQVENVLAGTSEAVPGCLF